MPIRDVIELLESAGISYALIGAHAVAVRGHSRSTMDWDFLTTDRSVFQRDLWKSIRGSVDIRQGDFDDPLAGVVRVRLADAQVDVVVGRWKWEQRVIDRAERIDIGELTVPVARTSDLILLKLAAGGVLDLQDAYNLLKVGDRAQLTREVEDSIHALDADAHAKWEQLKREE